VGASGPRCAKVGNGAGPHGHRPWSATIDDCVYAVPRGDPASLSVSQEDRLQAATQMPQAVARPARTLHLQIRDRPRTHAPSTSRSSPTHTPVRRRSAAVRENLSCRRTPVSGTLETRLREIPAALPHQMGERGPRARRVDNHPADGPKNRSCSRDKPLGRASCRNWRSRSSRVGVSKDRISEVSTEHNRRGTDLVACRPAAAAIRCASTEADNRPRWPSWSRSSTVPIQVPRVHSRPATPGTGLRSPHKEGELHGENAVGGCERPG